MEPFVDIPLVALAAAMLATAGWAAITTTRVSAWCSTAALLWLGTASFTACALTGSPLALVVLGSSVSGAAILVGAYAVFGRPRFVGGVKRAAPLEVRHALNAR